MELKLLGVDEFKEEFVVFYIDRGEDLNAYIWVYVDDDKVKLTDIYGLASYCKHSLSPIYVGDDMPEEMVEKAYQIISDMPKDQISEMLDAFNERDKMHREDEEEYKEREEYEDECIEEIQKGTKDGVFWFMS